MQTFLTADIIKVMKIIRPGIIILLFVTLLFPKSVLASENIISDLLNKNSVLLLGEVRGKKESSKFLSSFVSDYTKDGKCLNVGLEISSAKQADIDEYFQDKGEISQIGINTYVSHPAYMEMLGVFKTLIAEGRCIKVFGVDVPDTVPVEKDAWISRTISKIQSGTPMIVLLGNRFAFKSIEWSDEKIKKESIAQRLHNDGIKVATVLQYWDTDNCSWQNFDVILPDNKLSVPYLREIFSGTAAELPKDTSEVTDAIVVWNCGRLSKTVDSTASPDKKDTSDASDDGVKNNTTYINPQVKPETDRKKIESNIRRGYLLIGMIKDDVIRTLGEPKTRDKLSDTYEKWAYECYDEEGFYFKCNVVTFENDTLIKIEHWSY